jgi:hypothetical protein
MAQTALQIIEEAQRESLLGLQIEVGLAKWMPSIEKDHRVAASG